MSSVSLSVIAPARNEAANLPRLVAEVEVAGRAMAGTLGGAFEFIVVDDGSTDDTRAVMRSLGGVAGRPWLRCVSPDDGARGQSAAFHAGFRAARGGIVATLDADLQNDPADLVAMLERFVRTGADMVQGDRSGGRRDGLVRRVGSGVGRLVRRWILGDTIRDTGCSLRVMRRDLAVRLPLEFRGMHRFIPVLARDLGATVVEMPVRHRPRHAGRSNYGLGIGRAIPGLIDCLAVRWMRSRRQLAGGVVTVDVAVPHAAPPVVDPAPADMPEAVR